MRCSVETITADTIFFEIFVRYRIQICIVGHSLVESSIEYSYLWYFRQQFLYSIDTFQVCWVVQRAQVAAFFYSCNNSVVNQYRAAEFCSSVQYTMTYCFDFVQVIYCTVFCVSQCVENKLYTSSMFRYVSRYGIFRNIIR